MRHNPTEYEFVIGGGLVVIDGHPEWPDHLTLHMTSEEAIALIGRLATSLQIYEDVLPLAVVGRLQRIG